MKIHIVKSGDTLYKIAKKYGVKLDDLIAMNSHIENPDQIDVGMKVKIPTGTKPLVAKEQLTKPMMDKEQLTKPQQLAPKPETKPQQLAPKPEMKPQQLAPKPEVKKEIEVKIEAESNVKPKQEVKPEPKQEAVKPIAKEDTKPQSKDLFDQFKVPAYPAASFYDLPDIPGMDEIKTGASENQKMPNPTAGQHAQNLAPSLGGANQMGYSVYQYPTPNVQQNVSASGNVGPLGSNVSPFGGNAGPLGSNVSPISSPVGYGNPSFPAENSPFSPFAANPAMMGQMMPNQQPYMGMQNPYMMPLMAGNPYAPYGGQGPYQVMGGPNAPLSPMSANPAGVQGHQEDCGCGGYRNEQENSESNESELQNARGKKQMKTKSKKTTARKKKPVRTIQIEEPSKGYSTPWINF